MARATKWTEEKVKALKPDDGRSEQRKLVAPNLYLYLRTKSDGTLSRHWQYRAQVGGARRWLSLGSFPEVGLAKADAERKAHDMVHEAAKKGDADHPVIAARQERKAKKAMPTVAEVFDEWIGDKRMGSARKGGLPVRERTVTVLTENFDVDIRNRIGDAKIARVTREALQGCIDAPRKRSAPGAAAHVYRTLRGLVSFAIKRGYIDGPDPMRGIDNPKPYRPAPVIAASDAEIVSLLKALDDSSLWMSTRLAIEFQLLTGARPSEVRLATWSEINADKARWTIPADRVKSGREFRVHLSKAALEVLAQAKAIAANVEMKDGKKLDFVFPGAKGGGMDKMAVARALSRLVDRVEAQGGKKLRPHDLRRTFRTMLSRIGIAPHVAELCMNHQESETMRRVYDGHDYGAEVVDAWGRAGAHITAIRRGAAKVVAFRAA